MLQALAVVPIVTGCTCYAAWALMPAVLRRRAAAALLILPWPAALRARLQRHANAGASASGCACEGCDHGSAAGQQPAAEPAVHTLRFHPWPPR